MDGGSFHSFYSISRSLWFGGITQRERSMLVGSGCWWICFFFPSFLFFVFRFSFFFFKFFAYLTLKAPQLNMHCAKVGGKKERKGGWVGCQTDNFSVYIQICLFFYLSLLSLLALSIISKPRREKKKEKKAWNVEFSVLICRQSMLCTVRRPALKS